METDKLDKLIKSAAKLATLPEIYHRIDQAVESPDGSLDDIGRIIQDDPPFASRLLKIANSSFFSYPHPVTTITRALTVVGVRQLRDLVMATAVLNLFNGSSENQINLTAFWRHSIACGLAARVIATYRREANVESLYVTGLLHDIGLLILFQHRAELIKSAIEQCRMDKMLLHEIEMKIFGFNHAMVGGALMASWKLPERLHVPVTWHHLPSHAPSYTVETATVHVADIIAQSMRLSSGGECFVPPLDPEAWERLELSVSLLPAIVQQVETLFDDAVKIFLS